jgi:hypothetical protein
MMNLLFHQQMCLDDVAPSLVEIPIPPVVAAFYVDRDGNFYVDRDGNFYVARS